MPGASCHNDGNDYYNTFIALQYIDNIIVTYQEKNDWYYNSIQY